MPPNYESAELFAQAATLVADIALAYAFSDGNERLAAALGVIFLYANGVAITGDHIDLADEVLRIVNRRGSLPEATAGLAGWLRAHAAPAPQGE